ncbi:hypothetical protein PFISCL1PPCAC_7870, partial [Pristionchus fissidentatus]
SRTFASFRQCLDYLMVLRVVGRLANRIVPLSQTAAEMQYPHAEKSEANLHSTACNQEKRREWVKKLKTFVFQSHHMQNIDLIVPKIRARSC